MTKGKNRHSPALTGTGAAIRAKVYPSHGKFENFLSANASASLSFVQETAWAIAIGTPSKLKGTPMRRVAIVSQSSHPDLESEMSRSPFFPKFSDLPAEIPIFPLDGAVVMPGVQLPLNIFEPRYLAMVRAALAADHLIGMIQPAAEARSDQRPPIQSVGCAGRITSYNETNDGRIVLVLTGICRFQVCEELSERHGYRRVRPDWERYTRDLQENESELVDRGEFLTSLRSFCGLRNVEIPWDDIDKMSDGDLVNLLCAHLPLDSGDKQALVETIDLAERADLMRGLLDMSSVADAQGSAYRH